MYKSHFGLQEQPFGITPDTSFAYACASHQEALNTLLVAVKNGEGFIKITGEVGTGKTLLLALAGELGVELSPEADQHHLIKGLTQALLQFAAQNKSVVLCLDEAQAMPLESLEALRLLTNLETEKRKLLQVVLFGQPELDEKLNQKSVRQLRQRITFQYHLDALGGEELDYYLAHRLRVAGYVGNRLFTKRAVGVLHRATGGIPRLVNVLSHKAMMLAFGEGLAQVLPHHVHAAASDTPSIQRRRWRWYVTALFFIVAGSVGWVVTQ